ncbi:hypothetical protein [Aliiruegeria sabulilitoris]|uniref:hypothetical protein n=1 Tax=Aliiruegeria sabulilitoris TaxID=1510458 RepID=UPI000830B1DA|nr:hypothetical protein [Aliiruegeria sabulilitoris]NDR55316.1 hypothetical protein [Pseudoruegeria sp. M32A2M]
MGRWILVAFFLTGVAGAPAASQSVLEEAQAFNPYSETAIAITGPVILSSKRMVFETGQLLDLDLVDQAASGDWGASGNVPVAQVFRISGDVGPLRQQNTLCGDQPVTYMAVWDEESSGSKILGIAMFTGTEIPTGVAQEGICATYFFATNAAS